MVEQPQSPRKRPFSEISDSDSEWEYEYSTTETETVYVTLDLSSHSNSTASNPKKRKPKHNLQTGIPDTDRLPETPSRETDLPTTLPSATTEEERIQILDLCSKNPLISYGGTVYSCEWTEPLGTDVLLQAPPPQPPTSSREKGQQPSPVLAWSRLRLVAKPMKLVPHADARRQHKDNVFADGTLVPGAPQPISLRAQSQPETGAPSASELNPSSDIVLPDPSSTREEVTASEPSIPTTADSTTLQPPSPAPSASHDPPATAPAVSDPPHEASRPPNMTSLLPTNEPLTDPSPPPNLQPQDPSLQHPPPSPPAPHPTTPLTAPASTPPTAQASFLARLSHAKQARSETDSVPLHTTKPQGSGWRVLGRRSHHGPGAASKYIPVRDRIVGYIEDEDEGVDEGVDEEEAAVMGEEELKARGLTRKGKKIGRPRGRGKGGGMAGGGGERGGAGGGRGTGRGSRRTRGRGSRGGWGSGGGRGWEEDAREGDGGVDETAGGRPVVWSEERTEPAALPKEDATANAPPTGQLESPDMHMSGAIGVEETANSSANALTARIPPRGEQETADVQMGGAFDTSSTGLEAGQDGAATGHPMLSEDRPGPTGSMEGGASAGSARSIEEESTNMQTSGASPMPSTANSPLNANTANTASAAAESSSADVQMSDAHVADPISNPPVREVEAPASEPTHPIQTPKDGQDTVAAEHEEWKLDDNEKMV